jgi:glutathione S-transferase
MLRVDASDPLETHPVGNSTDIRGPRPADRQNTLWLFDVMDRQLESSDHLAGDFGIADIARRAWVLRHASSGDRYDQP